MIVEGAGGLEGAMAAGDPERLGGYWVARRLGEGGQGVVYEAYDDAGARVAVKVLRRGARGATSPGRWRRPSGWRRSARRG
ncbi:hypothetical protein [Thermocatellispora tengchongensis]|uniref:hypothetical protein n=1 Tax=Thermocatellispora tengchongensis TaxID=1073253 RepID=UPI00362C4F63